MFCARNSSSYTLAIDEHSACDKKWRQVKPSNTHLVLTKGTFFRKVECAILRKRTIVKCGCHGNLDSFTLIIFIIFVIPTRDLFVYSSWTWGSLIVLIIYQMDFILRTIHDANLKLTLSFGIGLHHAGLHEHDRKTVEELFVNQKIQVRCIYTFILVAGRDSKIVPSLPDRLRNMEPRHSKGFCIHALWLDSVDDPPFTL